MNTCTKISIWLSIAIMAVLALAMWISPEPHILEMDTEYFDAVDAQQHPYFWKENTSGANSGTKQ